MKRKERREKIKKNIQTFVQIIFLFPFCKEKKMKANENDKHIHTASRKLEELKEAKGDAK